MARKVVCLICVCAVVLAATISFAAVPAKDGAPLSYSCRFARNAWNADDWVMVKSPRWSYIGTWVQCDDHIVNSTPSDATASELSDSKAPETYTSMVLKPKVGGSVTISCKMSFDDQMAPLIVLANTLGADSKGYPEYRDHTEIVIHNGGINVWQHYYRDGKPSWVKLAWLECRLKPKVKYDVKVTVVGKQITVTAGGHTLGCTDNDLPDLFHVGLTGCEGKNRFYEFGVDAKG